MHIGQQRKLKKMMNHILQKYYTEWKKENKIHILLTLFGEAQKEEAQEGKEEAQS